MSKDICAVMSNIDSFHSCTVGSDFGFNGVSITVRPPAPSLLAMVPASAMGAAIATGDAPIGRVMAALDVTLLTGIVITSFRWAAIRSAETSWWTTLHFARDARKGLARAGPCRDPLRSAHRWPSPNSSGAHRPQPGRQLPAHERMSASSFLACRRRAPYGAG
jgi:hypothetical protein